jgi:hypothetical protein
VSRIRIATRSPLPTPSAARPAHPRDLIGQDAGPRAVALAQRHLVAAAVRQVGVEEAGGEVVVALGHGAS